MGGISEYESYDGVGLAELVRSKAVKPEELLEECICRIETLNPRLNAVVQKMYDLAKAHLNARQGKKGAFEGVPFLLKDLGVDYAGVPTRRGSRFLQNSVADHDSELVERYKATGVTVLGKSNTPEFGLMPFTEPELFGPTLNPWSPERSPGGSSGGSAAAVAARIVPLAHGNDGGGSIRIPASCCGLFGLKPTRGRNPIGPDIPDYWHGLVCDHVLTRSVRDSAAMLDATCGPDVGAPYYVPSPVCPYLDGVSVDPGRLRIAFTSLPFLGDTVHDDCLKGLELAAQLCADLGHVMVEDAPQIDAKAYMDAHVMMTAGFLRADIGRMERHLGRKASYGDVELGTWAGYLLGKAISGAEFSEALHTILMIGRTMGRFFERYDILLTPTLAAPPPLIGDLQLKAGETFIMKILSRLGSGKLLRLLINGMGGLSAFAGQIFDFMPYTPLFNASGQPAMSVPLHWSDAGLPIGMQFVGRYGDESTLFRLAGQLEAAHPWIQRTPTPPSS